MPRLFRSVFDVRAEHAIEAPSSSAPRACELLVGEPQRCGASRLLEHDRFEQCAHLPMLLDGMPQRQPRANLIDVLAPVTLVGEIVARFQLRDDPLHGTLRDADPVCDVPDARPWIADDADQYVRVIREERPLAVPSHVLGLFFLHVHEAT